METSLLTLTALLLLGVREGITLTDLTANISNVTSANSTNHTDNTSFPCIKQSPCPTSVTEKIIQTPVFARLKIVWSTGSQCEGQLYVFSAELRKTPLCDVPELQKWSNELCRDAKCGDLKNVMKMLKYENGYVINNNMTVSNASCQGLHVICKDNLGKELAAYKAITGILIFFILSVTLLQFSRPTYKALRKRFSQKRQNRWIGPTQSQSVSYHRGQAGGHPNNNTVNRHSYPGLEKLTVNHSREPSSNRNSDYDSFGYN